MVLRNISTKRNVTILTFTHSKICELVYTIGLNCIDCLWYRVQILFAGHILMEASDICYVINEGHIVKSGKYHDINDITTFET